MVVQDKPAVTNSAHETASVTETVVPGVGGPATETKAIRANVANAKATNTKVAISIRIDREVLEWFKSQGQGYQTAINAVLLSHVASAKDAASKTPHQK